MQVLISHRGNLSGPNSEEENSPNYINKALREGYNVEIDVWYRDGSFYLGHDQPDHLVSIEFLKNRRLWLHAKDIDALYAIDRLLGGGHCNFFFHDRDRVTLTNWGYFWTYPGQKLTSQSVAVLPEEVPNWHNLDGCFGICSDYISQYG